MYMQTIQQAELHLLDITTERSVYRTALETKNQLLPSSSQMAPSLHHHQRHSDQPTPHLSLPSLAGQTFHEKREGLGT